MTNNRISSPMMMMSPDYSYCSGSSQQSTTLSIATSTTSTTATTPDSTASAGAQNNTFGQNNNHVRVIARIRPMNEAEARRGCRPCIYPDEMEAENDEEQENNRHQTMIGFGNNNNSNITPSSSSGILSRLGGSIRNSFHSPPAYQGKNAQDVAAETELLDATPLTSNVNRELYRRDSISPALLLPSINKSKLKSPTPSRLSSLSSPPLLLPPSSSSLPKPSSRATTTTTNTNPTPPPPPTSRGGGHHKYPKRLIAESTNASFSSPSGYCSKDNNKRSFDFDTVLSSKSTQHDVYQIAVGDAVQRNVLRGYHTTILAYGQTGSGKTHTMAGRTSATTGNYNDNNNDNGIIGRALQELFTAKEELMASGEHHVTLRLSCMEIYQEEIRDLLDTRNDKTHNLQLRDHGERRRRRGSIGGGVEVVGLTNVIVESIDRVHELMDHATQRRTTASTKLNERSSRSHAIYTVTTTIAPKRTPKNKNRGKQTKQSLTTMSKLTFIDLAGSERMKKTGAEGERAQEGININKDLFVLGKVVSALAEKARLQEKDSSKTIHVPYRDSKLTRLLRDSLGGNCCTVLIACVSPADVNVDESINTLRYAERSRKITNSMKRNVVGANANNALTPAQFASLRAENKSLKAQIMILQKRIVESGNGDGDGNGNDNNSTAGNSQLSSINDDLVSGLYAKLRLAEEQAKSCREKSRLVAQTAGRWREHCENYNNNHNSTTPSTTNNKNTALLNSDSSQFDSVVSPCLSYELSMAAGGDDDECSLIGDEDDDCFLDMEITTKKSLSEDDLARLKIEVDALRNEKDLMKDSLLELSDQIEIKRSDLEKMEEEYDQRQSELTDEVEQEEAHRDELLLEVSKLKEQLSGITSPSESHHPSTTGLRSLIRGFTTTAGGDSGTDTHRHVTDEEGDEMVEMRTLNHSNPNSCNSTNNKKGGAAAASDSEGMKLAIELGRSLGEETKRCEELQGQVTNLEKKLELQQSQNAELLHNNRALTEEVTTLKAKYGLENKNESAEITPTTSSEDHPDMVLCNLGDLKGSNDHMIKARAEEILRNLGAFGGGNGSTATSECNSSMISSLCATYAGAESAAVLISNINEADRCTCEAAMFGENIEHINFYLPMLGVPCVCGRGDNNSSNNNNGATKSDDLCALENILRPWQVEFITSVGIQGTAIEFVHAFKERGSVLAKELRRWRKKKRMSTVRTKSCRVALHIWNRTCKSVIKYVREQKSLVGTGVVLQKPDFLQVNFANSGDMNTVSTLGVDSSFCFNNDNNNDFGEFVTTSEIIDGEHNFIDV